MTVLKALKKMFGKSEAEQLAPGSSAPAHVQGSRNDGQQPGRTAPVASPKKEPVTTPATVNVAEEPAADQPRQEPRQEKPRRERAPKPVVIPWKLEDFAVEPQEGKTRFHDFKLAPELMHAIQDLGFPYCTPIQAQVLGFTLAGKDAIGRAQTGTGKTAAFLISIITQLLQTPPPKERYMGEPRALIIAPTRELVVQIAKDAADLTKYTGLNVMTFVGGMDFDKQLKHLEARHCDILVATPGRLLDFNQRGDVHLDMVEVMVLDEADRMLDMGFIPQVRQIIRQTPPKNERQTLLFSATFTEDVMNLAKQWTTDPSIVEIEALNVASENVEQHIYAVAGADKYKLLYNLVNDNGWERVMVFANRKDEVRRIEERLVRDGVNAAQLSGDVPQHKRIKTLEGFREGKIRVLVATDVAGRGIHIDGISHVINFTLPEVPDDYVHRIGRTGRAGAAGVSISFAGEDDSYQLPSIETLLGRKISCETPPTHLLRPVERKRP
ncbi:ATP-dependent RNA helicase RhlB [Pseudomonas sp. D8002]|jgi:ATP-dependent RNA helicase RhlB|uniref:ATP-dependent RNA helicase RhlB n=1 Tax=Pseudomonas yamanorum TaxID=515393 RepID=A0ABU1CZ76_9PSED|nr:MULTISPECIES: ATP-dependent RNA helicase RhlB [Pseudomonas]MDP9060441.1 ATP-dependent RNA helicase RhlB [Pseudomonadota bacterium]WEL41555.1 ATP-dependent RNA helicase RhlB [Pseudomonas sp. CBSPBW29]WEL62611.1 ATP-dependent RNA helicase RhlB [Pseudomonas sp. CBSPGW29]WEL71801.1 ATP-dependent RNA helicase RhlB [Pseudomonas sp. CBSPCGW29]WEL78708.1 ATP-dependent RNA helicase RhlB [Pseudomonas sp. CBSPAW29]WEL82649.1 ATP-dependent RNA helicase RhlB [Pseudomonas sp. CBSPCAW29]